MGENHTGINFNPTENKQTNKNQKTLLKSRFFTNKGQLISGFFILYRVHLMNKSGWVRIILESISIPLKTNKQTKIRKNNQ